MAAARIPGFYFDVEKGKYFKIQPDHQLPPDAKHARGNVIKEQRAQKRQKAAHFPRQKKDRVAALSPVQRVSVQQERCLTQAIMAREVGFCGSPDTTNNILVRRSRVVTTEYPWPVIHQPHNVVQQPRNLIEYAIPRPTKGSIYTVGKEGVRLFPWNNLPKQRLMLQDYEHGRMLGPRISHSITVCPRSTRFDAAFYNIIAMPTALVYYRYYLNDGARQYCYVPWPQSFAGFPEYKAPQAAVFSPDESKMIVSADSWVFSIDCERYKGTQCWQSNEGGRGLSWFDSHIIAVDEDKAVKLWDIRTDHHTRVLRFNNRRHVTGIEAVNEHQLLVADNYSLALFDTRWAAKANDLPTLRLSVRQELAQAKMGVSAQSIVAVYGQGCVQLLSLRTGQLLQTLELRGSQRGSVITDLSWWDDATGVPYVQACVGSSIHHIIM